MTKKHLQAARARGARERVSRLQARRMSSNPECLRSNFAMSHFLIQAGFITTRFGAATTPGWSDSVSIFSVRDLGVNERDTRVSYTETTARYLRTRIGDSDEGELEISGAAVSYEKETPPVEMRWPVDLSPTTSDAQRRVAVVDLDLGGEGLPVHRLAVTFSNVNFYREDYLWASADRAQWRTVLSGAAIYVYDTPKFAGTSLLLSFAEITSRYLQFLLHDEDNPPIDIQTVEATGLQRRIVFAADPAQSYPLFYGNAGARPSSYDVERFSQYLDTEDLPQARLGVEAPNPPLSRDFAPIAAAMFQLVQV